ncbi:MAG: hypothetical protein ABI581_04055 [Sediminibacterium sp.]
MRDNGLHIIRSIQKKWILSTFISHVLLSAAIVLLITYLLHRFLDLSSWYVFPLFIIVFAALCFIDDSWRIKEEEVTRFLNRSYPSLEESSELLLKKPAALNLLEQLQAEKTTDALLQIGQPSLFNKKIKRSLTGLVVAGSICLLTAWLFNTFQLKEDLFSTGTAAKKAIKLPIGVSEVKVRIIPPTYTRKRAYEQSGFDLRVEEDAAIHWRISTSAPVKSLQFIHNDSLVIKLNPTNAEHTVWQMDKLVSQPGFYQLKIDSAVSELYKIEIIKDIAPVIIVHAPKPTTVIDFGEPAKVNLHTTVTDDYGVKDVSIDATIAKGSGEGVKFKKQKLSFGTSFTSQQLQYQLQKTIGLTALGMEPGDELYFYVSAIDNHEQEKRSDIFIVSITDTASLMSMDGLLNGVNLKPDYFRSQRQIILDAEQLLREKDTVTAENFKNRSNNLGIDQKLLRLRYGKYLGEEASSNDDVTGDNGLGNPADFGNAALILDAFTDHHDNAEDATFLDPETKKQLKAVLTEMWSSELQLRTFKPKDALPFAYKALRLLKDLQQRSRVYVAKTSIKTAPIKLERRLTGKLEKIIEPVTRTNISAASRPVEELRNALYVLEQLKTTNVVDERSIHMLRLAGIQVNNYAVREPGAYLKPLEAMKRIVQALNNRKSPMLTDISTSQKALQKMADAPLSLPSKKIVTPALSLSEQYFRNLQKTKTH